MASNLDDEIENLQAKVASLKNRLRVQTSTLLTAPSTHELLTSNKTTISPSLKQTLLSQSALQEAHNQQCLYRACATLTTFRAQDPDPHAVDGGAILGLRIEVVSRAKFLRPYYVLLNRPYSNGNRHLRVHRHTLPPCIPLAGLAGRYLPAPGKVGGGGGGDKDGNGREGRGEGRKQDFARFARVLRREMVRYHHRLGIVADLRKAAGLGRKRDAEGEEYEVGEGAKEGNRLADISPADAEAKQLTIEWADGRTGRLVMGDDGEIVKVVVVGDNGRDREGGRELLGGAVRVEEVVKRLAALD